MSYLKLFCLAPSNPNSIFNLLLGTTCLTGAFYSQEDNENEKSPALPEAIKQHKIIDFSEHYQWTRKMEGSYNRSCFPFTEPIESLKDMSCEGWGCLEEDSVHVVHSLELITEYFGGIDELKTVKSEAGSLEESFIIDDEESIVVDI